MKDFEVIDIGEHNRLKQELAETKAKVDILKKLADERAQFINNGVEFGFITLPDYKDDPALVTYNRCQLTTEGAIIDINKQGDNQSLPERKSLGESKNWGDE